MLTCWIKTLNTRPAKHQRVSILFFYLWWLCYGSSVVCSEVIEPCGEPAAWWDAVPALCCSGSHSVFTSNTMTEMTKFLLWIIPAIMWVSGQLSEPGDLPLGTDLDQRRSLSDCHWGENVPTARLIELFKGEPRYYSTKALFPCLSSFEMSHFIKSIPVWSLVTETI